MEPIFEGEYRCRPLTLFHDFQDKMDRFRDKTALVCTKALAVKFHWIGHGGPCGCPENAQAIVAASGQLEDSPAIFHHLECSANSFGGNPDNVH